MIKRHFLFLAIIATLFLKISAQTFTYRTGLKEMCGDPGDIFSCSISFTNTAGTPINIFINRYQKTMPAYWYSCYCYQQCNSPIRDTITLHIPAFTTDVIYVQFKTDSVNPGVSFSDFTINQIGFENNADSIQMTASTGCDLALGLNDLNTNYMSLFPNPATDILIVSHNSEIVNEVKIYTIVGQLKESIISESTTSQSISLKNYENGMYIIELYTHKRKYIRRFIKE